jgi:hypothetical protein
MIKFFHGDVGGNNPCSSVLQNQRHLLVAKSVQQVEQSGLENGLPVGHGRPSSQGLPSDARIPRLTCSAASFCRFSPLASSNQVWIGYVLPRPDQQNSRWHRLDKVSQVLSLFGYELTTRKKR